MQTRLMADDSVARFIYERPSLESYWRAIILFGRNVASYKFALGGALLELGAGSELVTLDDLAVPFARRIVEHLRDHDRQGTFEQSRFLDACRAFNRGELGEDGLRGKTVQLGFVNVLDAFHVVDQAEVPRRFFVDERKSANGIRLTDELREILRSGQGKVLGAEAESRWRLVEARAARRSATGLRAQLAIFDWIGAWPQPAPTPLLLPGGQPDRLRDRHAA